MIKTLFHWLDLHPGIYAPLAWLPVVLLVAWCHRLSQRSRPAGRLRASGMDAGSLGLIFLVLLAWRWPMLLGISTVGPAEAEAIAAALTLATDWLPFSATDLAHGGPLTAWILWPTHCLGVPLDYFNARVVALGLDWIALSAGYVALRARFNPGTAVAALFLPLMLLSNAVDPAVYQYGPRHLLLALAGWSGVWLWLGRCDQSTTRWSPGPWRILAAGIAVAAVGWCGVAAGPWMVGLFLLGLALLHRRGGGLRFTLTVGYGTALGLCWIHGIDAFPDFRLSYGAPAPTAFHAPPGGIVFLLAPAVALTAAGLLAWSDQRVWRPRIVLGLGAAAVVLGATRPTPEIFGHFAAYWRAPRGDLAQAIAASMQPGDRLAMWGRDASVYVETGLAQATHSATNERETRLDDPVGRAFRDRYVREFAARPPVYAVVEHDGAAAADDTLPDAIRTQLAADYVDLGSFGNAELFMRGQLAADRLVPRPGIVPLAIETATQAESVGGMAYVRDQPNHVRIFAHAPSVLQHPIPVGVLRLRGRFGFSASVLQQPSAPTDGAIFVVELVQPDGTTTRGFERLLEPIEHEADRPPADLVVELAGTTATQVRLRILPRAHNVCDWTYWEDLQFDVLDSRPASAQ